MNKEKLKRSLLENGVRAQAVDLMCEVLMEMREEPEQEKVRSFQDVYVVLYMCNGTTQIDSVYVDLKHARRRAENLTSLEDGTMACVNVHPLVPRLG